LPGSQRSGESCTRTTKGAETRPKSSPAYRGIARWGGAVRFPSGKIQEYTISLQGYPQQDKSYVLFLKRDEFGDYLIVTGYEVRGSMVQPLDGKRNLPKNEPDLQFGIYRGVSLESFRNGLQKALQQANRG